MTEGTADMRATMPRALLSPARATLVAAGLALSGCSSLMHPPNGQSIAGLHPSGTVTVTEDFLAGFGGGNGQLTFQGQTYPFQLIGTVVGPGGGLSKTTASGEVYKLAGVADFPGRYTQSTGVPGLETSGSSDLWLQNGSGVIMHLRGSSRGAMLTLGREEVYVRMPRQ